MCRHIEANNKIKTGDNIMVEIHFDHFGNNNLKQFDGSLLVV